MPPTEWWYGFGVGFLSGIAAASFFLELAMLAVRSLRMPETRLRVEEVRDRLREVRKTDRLELGFASRARTGSEEAGSGGQRAGNAAVRPATYTAGATRLVLFFVILLGANSARAQIALVGHNSAVAGSPGGTATTPSINCAGANFTAVVSVDFSAASTSDTITDSQGNTGYQNIGNYANGSANGTLWYKANASVSGSMTFSGTGMYTAIFASCWSGVATSSPLDQSSGSSTNITGSITPTQANELVITGTSFTNGMFYGDPSGYTGLDNQPLVGGSNEGGADAYVIQNSAMATNPTWPNVSGPSFIASFEENGSGPPPSTGPCTLSLAGAGTCFVLDFLPSAYSVNQAALTNFAGCYSTDTTCTLAVSICDENNNCLTEPVGSHTLTLNFLRDAVPTAVASTSVQVTAQ